MQVKWIGALAGMLAIGAAALLLLRGFSQTDAPIRMTQSVAELQPRVAVDSQRYNFGTMDVGQEGEHWFTIRNEGSGPLKLTQGTTSCSCTLSDLEGNKVPPGGERACGCDGSRPRPRSCSHRGPPFTPTTRSRSRCIFRLSATCAVHLGHHAGDGRVLQRACGRAGHGRFVVYSQVWEAFEVDVRSTHPQLSVETQPADESVLAPLEAKCGHVVLLTLAPGLKPGLFHTELKLAATAGDLLPARELTVQVGGQVSPSVWLEGPNLVESNLLDLGTITRGVGKKRSMALFVRGKGAEANITGVHVRPEALKVKFGARERSLGDACPLSDRCGGSAGGAGHGACGRPGGRDSADHRSSRGAGAAVESRLCRPRCSLTRIAARKEDHGDQYASLAEDCGVPICSPAPAAGRMLGA